MLVEVLDDLVGVLSGDPIDGFQSLDVAITELQEGLALRHLGVGQVDWVNDVNSRSGTGV